MLVHIAFVIITVLVHSFL